MSDFDPTKPITDPTVFFPKGLYVDNRVPKYDENYGEYVYDKSDDTKAFVLQSSDMKSLNRFLITGRLLQTTRPEYLRMLGIRNTEGVISTALEEVLTALLKTYGEIRDDCVEFKDHTWNTIIKLAQDIKAYAAQSGGKQTTSYYVIMLKAIGDYNKERKKASPDKDKLAELKEAIQYIVDAKLNKLETLQDRAQTVVKGLGGFELKCHGHEQTVKADAMAIDNQLKKEGNDTESIKNKMDAAYKDVMDLAREVMERNNVIYMVKRIWFIGGIIAYFLTKDLEKVEVRLKAARKKLQEVLRDYDKSKGAGAMTLNLTYITDQVEDLGSRIKPAITTLEKLHGIWDNMAGDLRNISELIKSNAEDIPPMLLTEGNLQGIVDAWNELKQYASDYIEHSHLSDDPELSTFGENFFAKLYEE